MKLPAPQIPDDYVSIKRDYTPEEYELVMKHGKRYKPAVSPPDVRRGRPGWCYDDTMMACMQVREKYKYVEGLAKPTPDEDWKLHAWLTDGVHAFDPTWFATNAKGRMRPIPGEYVGIEMPLLTVMLFVRATEYQGIIPNRHRYPHALQSVIGHAL